jgi:hypothetical protein
MADYQTIIDIARSMELAIEAKGYKTVDLEFKLNYSDYNDFYISMRYELDGVVKYETFSHATSGAASIQDTIQEAQDFIAALPSIEDARNADFLSQLGRTIDRAAELNLPLDYVAPLKEAFAAMTENLLPDHRTAAERDTTVVKPDSDEVPF